jgi:DNA repair protein RadC
LDEVVYGADMSFNFRETLVNQGSQALTTQELVAVLLGSGTMGNTLVDLADQVTGAMLQKQYGAQDLLAIKGIHTAQAARIIAAAAFSERLQQRKKLELITPQAIYEQCTDIIAQRTEHVICFALDVRSNLLRRWLVSIGTAHAALVHPREVFYQAITHQAAAIIIAHNHPSGDHSPSNADKEITRQLVQAGTVIGIPVLDHLVCAEQGFTSLRLVWPELF